MENPIPKKINKIGNYENMGSLGEGKFGKVYRGRNLTTNAVVAIKVFENCNPNEVDKEVNLMH